MEAILAIPFMEKSWATPFDSRHETGLRMRKIFTSKGDIIIFGLALSYDKKYQEVRWFLENSDWPSLFSISPSRPFMLTHDP